MEAGKTRLTAPKIRKKETVTCFSLRDFRSFDGTMLY